MKWDRPSDNQILLNNTHGFVFDIQLIKFQFESSQPTCGG